MYLLSHYDNLAHTGQWMMGLNPTYDFPVASSLVALPRDEWRLLWYIPNQSVSNSWRWLMG